MSEEVLMPRLSDTMEEGTISRWLKHEGDRVDKGDVLVEIETDKANMEYPAYLEGVLQKVLVQEGQTVKIGEAIALIGAAGDAAAAPPANAPAATAAPGTAADAAPSGGQQATGAGQGPPAGEEAATAKPEGRPAEAPAAPTSAPSRQPGEVSREGGPQRSGEVSVGAERLVATPLARRLARERKIDLSHITGSGPGGRIVRDDIENYRPAVVPSQPAAAPPPAAAPATEGVTTKPLSRMQQVVARRMVESKTQVPHFYVSNEVDMEAFLDLRRRLNEGADKEQQVRVDALFLRACGLALRRFPDVNGSFHDGQFEFHDYVNIGFAVALPEGLVVPVVRDCDTKGIRQIDQDMRPLIERARANKLAPADMDRSTFSISNMGMFDVTEFGAVVNQPNAAILAIGATRQLPTVVDGQIAIRNRVSLTLSCDHRIVYGATGAQFLQELKRLLQTPYSLIL